MSTQEEETLKFFEKLGLNKNSYENFLFNKKFSFDFVNKQTTNIVLTSQNTKNQELCQTGTKSEMN